MTQHIRADREACLPAARFPRTDRWQPLQPGTHIRCNVLRRHARTDGYPPADADRSMWIVAVQDVLPPQVKPNAGRNARRIVLIHTRRHAQDEHRNDDGHAMAYCAGTHTWRASSGLPLQRNPATQPL